jgi:hypothetical protein
MILCLNVLCAYAVVWWVLLLLLLQAVQDLCSYLCYGLKAALELCLCVALLFVVLGPAAIGGLIIMLIGIPSALALSKWYAADCFPSQNCSPSFSYLHAKVSHCSRCSF